MSPASREVPLPLIKELTNSEAMFIKFPYYLDVRFERQVSDSQIKNERRCQIGQPSMNVPCSLKKKNQNKTIKHLSFYFYLN